MLGAAAASITAKGVISRHRIGFGRRTDFPREFSVRWCRRSENLYRLCKGTHISHCPEHCRCRRKSKFAWSHTIHVIKKHFWRKLLRPAEVSPSHKKNCH